MTQQDSCNLIPLSNVISAALMDTKADYGQAYQSYAHWAARRYKTLARQTLKTGKRYATLTVNKNTHTATLPPDFKKELFVGYLNSDFHKVALPRRYQLANISVIENIEVADPCPKCSQSKSICDDLTVTKADEVIIVNGGSYTITTVKKLYSNGNYYLEKTFPYYNTITQTVEYTTTKKFIAEIALKDCGCPMQTNENIETIKYHCPDVYCNYYAHCDGCDTAIGGYNILEQSGLIQLDRKFTADKLYIEYLGFLPKLNGQYAMPEMAFETVVKGTVVDALSASKTTLSWQMQYAESRYKTARSALDKEMGLVSLDAIMQSISLIPKFDVSYRFRMDRTGSVATPEVVSAAVKDEACIAAASAATGGGSSSPKNYIAPFSLSVIVGNGANSPQSGVFTFTSPSLVGALNINHIIVNNNNESKDYGDFAFDTATGTLTKTNGNAFQLGDVIIIPYAKII